MRKVVDAGEVVLVYNEGGVLLDIWLSPASGVIASAALIEAFTRDEVTEGGLAEAGWRWIGQ